MKPLKRKLTYANAMATIAVFIALGSAGAFAATQLAKNSVGAKQIRTGAVRSPEVKDGSLLSKDFKTGQLPGGGNGQTGAPGSPGAPGEPGSQGPGAISVNGQVPVDGVGYDVKTVEGVRVTIDCRAAPGAVFLTVSSGASESSLYGWGTQWSDTSGIERAESNGKYLESEGFANADVDVVAEATAPGDTAVHYVRVDFNLLRAGGCNYHGLITPSS